MDQPTADAILATIETTIREEITPILQLLREEYPTKDQILEAIKDGVSSAFYELMPSTQDIRLAIRDGVSDAHRR